jgi:type II secretory ATPase GspE/PulE/Tfp pilus assembly ATPase PilB-like protein
MSDIPTKQNKIHIYKRDDTPDIPVADITPVFKSKGATGFIDYVVEYALSIDASDIHIDPFPDHSMVNMRVNGSLRSVFKLQKSLILECIGRIKILAKLRTDINNKAQDGRYEFVSQEKERIDMRVSTMPTFYGENAVMRILRPSKQRELSLNTLGMDEHQVTTLKRFVDKQQGLILVAGSTGSGKTTTIYAFCNLLIKSKRNVVTVEDPVEYLIEGARQIQIAENYFGFSDALRSVLRQDPDVIVVGEIRDSETANLAFRAALTGHLVIATIHAEDSYGVRDRLVDLGISESMLTLLKLVISQKLKPVTDEKQKVISRKADFHFLDLVNTDNDESSKNHTNKKPVT